MTKDDILCDCNIIHEDTVEHVRSEIVSDDRLSAMSKLFKVFGDGTRIKILSALNCHEMCVCDLAVILNMTKSATRTERQQPRKIFKERKTRLLFPGR